MIAPSVRVAVGTKFGMPEGANAKDKLRRFNLHTGDMIEGEVRTPKDGERYFALNKLDKINGLPPEANKHKVMFENLTPLFPKEQMRLERDIKSEENITGRIIDIIAPIGKGQRAQ